MDRTTKLLLAAIALGLWANAVATVVRPARADSNTVEMYISSIANGTCINRKICW